MNTNRRYRNRSGKLTSRIFRAATALLTLGLLGGPVATAQERSEPEVLLEDAHNGFVFAVSDKLTLVNGKFANFFGLYGGWLINHQFLVGLGGYGKTTGIHQLQMGYGGLVLEYYLNPNRLWHVSVRGLVGGGACGWAWADPFFVAEPEVKVTLNVTRWMRLGFGGGYRFVGGTPFWSDDLGGPTASLDLKFGRF